MGITLTEKIKQFALNDAGFDLAGVSSIRLPEFYGSAVERWVGDGFAGTMGYMERDGQKRAHPEASLPGARSVIALAVNYFHPEDPKPAGEAGKVAKYAYGADYHNVIEKRLKRLAVYIKETAGPGTEVKAYVDTGPILEKAFAKEAGLGFFGKNTNVITKEFGSFVFLASLITNVELEPDTPHAGACGSCRICIDACPTGALLGDYRMDARRCISYLTIETKGDTPAGLKDKMGDWAFGCDICQDVCPYNTKAKITRHAEFYPNKIAGSWLDMKEIAAIKSEEEFSERFKGGPVKRAKKILLKKGP